ncbi:MAG TPA: ABC transporter permease [Candidatus Tectomicrobia bacterium]
MRPVYSTPPLPGALRCERQADDTLVVHLVGHWTTRAGAPVVTEVYEQLDASPPVRRLAFEAQAMTGWDSRLLTFLRQVLEASTQRQIVVDQQGLPEGVRRLLALAAAVPEREGARRGATRLSWLASIGTDVLAGYKGARDMLDFIGQAVFACLRLAGGKARFRRVDLVLFIQECGAQALGIVTLISFLIGLILAFMGAVQLRQFGAQIYVADLVGLGMTREMGAVMTGVIMAGRTGAAFAAQLGTMQVNEEIDALSTMGIPPMEFLVLPRMLALMLMMPLLCIYADMVGMLAGMLIATGLLDLSLVEYVNETRYAVDLVDCGLGVFKSVVFGALIALAGCLRGMQCGRSASAVGAAATSAVVTGIVWIIATDGLFAVLTDRLGL